MQLIETTYVMGALTLSFARIKRMYQNLHPKERNFSSKKELLEENASK